MSEVTRILSAIEGSDPHAAEQLLPLPELAELVKLRYFAQMTVEQTAELLGLSPRTVKRNWVYASAWLRRAMDREAAAPPDVPPAE